MPPGSNARLVATPKWCCSRIDRDQMCLKFEAVEVDVVPLKKARMRRPERSATTLDRVHAAMLLQAGGKSNALRAMLQAEHEKGSEFLRLTNSLSALYPKDSEEKRLLDAMLLAMPR